MAASSLAAMDTNLLATSFRFPPLAPLPRRRSYPSGFPLLTTYRGLFARFCSLQVTPCLRRHLLAYACISGGGGFFDPSGESEEVSEASASDSKEAVLDLKLPRRNLLVRFTCNSCGERTQRLINRLAYERGTVFVQCAGCRVNHKLVDNLGLVVEYDLRNEKETDSEGSDS